MKYNWQRWFEAFSICRHCSRSTVFILAEANIDAIGESGIAAKRHNVNGLARVEGHITLKDNDPIEPPEHLPDDIEAVFSEGARCLAVNCFNDAGTMFRLFVYLAKTGIVTIEHNGGPNKQIRRSL